MRVLCILNTCSSPRRHTRQLEPGQPAHQGRPNAWLARRSTGLPRQGARLSDGKQRDRPRHVRSLHSWPTGGELSADSGAFDRQQLTARAQQRCRDRSEPIDRGDGSGGHVVGSRLGDLVAACHVFRAGSIDRHAGQAEICHDALEERRTAQHRFDKCDLQIGPGNGQDHTRQAGARADVDDRTLVAGSRQRPRRSSRHVAPTAGRSREVRSNPARLPPQRASRHTAPPAATCRRRWRGPTPEGLSFGYSWSAAAAGKSAELASVA